MSNEPTEKPIVLLVHGAWHRPLHYRLLIQDLQAQGFRVLAPPLASSGYDDSIDGKGWSDDVSRLQGALFPELDAGRKAIVVAHSYGGVPGTHVIQGQTVAEREARGLKGGIMSVVFIAAFPAVQAGPSLLEATRGRGLTLSLHDVVGTQLPLKMDVVKDHFYNDIEEDVRDEATRYLCKQSRAPLDEPIAFVGQDITTIPKTYVLCKNDNAIPPSVQQTALSTWNATPVEIEFGHSPFLKQDGREKLVKIISNAAKA